MAALPNLPSKYKAVQHYIKIASDHQKRDPAIAYYCYLYAVQKAMEIDKKSPECRAWLAATMDVLEKMKTEHKDMVEAFQNEIVGHSYVEDYTLKLFLGADNKDRSSQFDKALVKAFYTSGLLFDVLQQFGDLSEEMKMHQKYAKWKASYIHRCLTTGETPVAGPLPLEGENNDFGEEGAFNAPSYPSLQQPLPPAQPQYPATSAYPAPNAGGPYNYTTGNTVYPGTANAPGYFAQGGQPALDQQAPASRPALSPSASASVYIDTGKSLGPQGAAGNVALKPDDYQRAMKLCKFAQSAIQYEDSAAAIDNLSKALRLLTTGKE